MDLKVFIGYDEREHVAAEVCKYSIENRSSTSMVLYLKSQDLPEFKREREPNQATDFTYTRFLVPYLSEYRGWSIFCDCDFLFRAPIQYLLEYADPTKAVSVVQHPQYVPRTQVKMDGISQAPLFRKNWASLILFNNAHKSNQKLTPQYVNDVTPGKLLHQFAWLKDEEIGSIPLDWNCLNEYYFLENPKAIHFTDGGPWFPTYLNTTYSPLWIREFDAYQATLSSR